jgi:ABC-type oligopeptide transport system ATPase subunit
MLEAKDVSVSLPDRSRKPLFGQPPLLPIIQQIDLSIAPGEAVGVVGESGSGKSTLGRTLLGLHRPAQGRVVFEGKDLADLSERDLKRARLRIQMIFQDSQSSLNPRHRLVDILSGPFVAHGLADTRKARALALELLERVGLEPAYASRYPHELSGGQRQRVGIARAIALAPAFIVADEIVSGLDVSVQAQVLALLRQLRAENSLGMVFISHDLSVVRTLCDRIAVMQHGRIVETGDCAAVFRSPQHEYTRTLLRAIPLPVVDKHWLDESASAEGLTEPAAEAGRLN